MYEEDDNKEFNADSFADYWDSIQSDVEFGIDFMASKVVDEEGRELLGQTASILAQRHGVSSDKIKTYRMSMRKACWKAGIDEIWSPKKEKGTGSTPYMTLVPVIKHTQPAKSPQDLVYDRLLKGIHKGEYGLRDIELAVSGLNELERETGIDLH
jgi:hypothetical protein